MKTIYKILVLLLLFAYVIAAIGSTGYLFYYNEVLFAILNIVMAVMAFPVAYVCGQYLTGNLDETTNDDLP